MTLTLPQPWVRASANAQTLIAYDWSETPSRLFDVKPYLSSATDPQPWNQCKMRVRKIIPGLQQKMSQLCPNQVMNPSNTNPSVLADQDLSVDRFFCAYHGKCYGYDTVNKVRQRCYLDRVWKEIAKPVRDQNKVGALYQRLRNVLDGIKSLEDVTQSPLDNELTKYCNKHRSVFLAKCNQLVGKYQESCKTQVVNPITSKPNVVSKLICKPLSLKKQHHLNDVEDYLKKNRLIRNAVNTCLEDRANHDNDCVPPKAATIGHKNQLIDLTNTLQMCDNEIHTLTDLRKSLAPVTPVKSAWGTPFKSGGKKQKRRSKNYTKSRSRRHQSKSQKRKH